MLLQQQANQSNVIDGDEGVLTASATSEELSTPTDDDGYRLVNSRMLNELVAMSFRPWPELCLFKSNLLVLSRCSSCIHLPASSPFFFLTFPTRFSLPRSWSWGLHRGGGVSVMTIAVGM